MVTLTSREFAKFCLIDNNQTTGRLTPALTLSVHFRGKTLTQTQLRSFAQFNSLTIQGRINHAEIVDSKNGSFLAVTVISNCLNDDEGMTITFNSSNGLMGLFEKGYLPTGRVVTVTGHIAYVRETYQNKEGEIQMLKRPTIHLVDASIPTGGLGPMPADKAPTTTRRVGVVKPAQAKTSVLEELRAEVEEEAAAF